MFSVGSCATSVLANSECCEGIADIGADIDPVDMWGYALEQGCEPSGESVIEREQVEVNG